jgi:MerR family copper efflux transcriptional regulator
MATPASDPTPARTLLQIGEVAERVGLSLRTVRYYEEQGLLTPESRTAGGFRLYSEDQVDRLLLIKQMKPLGFTVQEMCELLEARDVARGADEGDRAAARARLANYAERAAERLDKLRRQLRDAQGLAEQLRDEATATAPGR